MFLLEEKGLGCLKYIRDRGGDWWLEVLKEAGEKK